MSNIITFKKISPTIDTNRLILILSYMCPEVSNIETGILEKCKDSIYAAYIENEMVGIIGCRKCYMEDVGLNDLPYHCQKHDLVYNLEILHVNPRYLSESGGLFKSVLHGLILECLASKNDAFTTILPKCNTFISNNDAIQYLEEYGFEQHNFADGTVLYLKYPITI